MGSYLVNNNPAFVYEAYYCPSGSSFLCNGLAVSTIGILPEAGKTAEEGLPSFVSCMDTASYSTAKSC